MDCYRPSLSMSLAAITALGCRHYSSALQQVCGDQRRRRDRSPARLGNLVFGSQTYQDKFIPGPAGIASPNFFTPSVKWITSASSFPGHVWAYRAAQADFNVRGWQGRWRYTAPTALFFYGLRS
jgi:hypothetical protein